MALDLQNEALDLEKEPPELGGRFWACFGRAPLVAGGPFGRLLGSILRGFSHKIRIEFSMSFSEAFWRHFGSIWEAFGPHFGSFFVEKWFRKASRREKHDFHKNLVKPYVFHTF